MPTTSTVPAATRRFNSNYPANFPRFVQHAIWQFCAEAGSTLQRPAYRRPPKLRANRLPARRDCARVALNRSKAHATDLKRGCTGSPVRYDCSMLQALRAEDALAIAEVSRRRSRDEQAMVQYLGIGRGARANGAPLDGALLRHQDDVDLAAFESEDRRRLEVAIAQLSPDARRELIALIWLVQRPLLSFEAALRRTRRIPPAA
jgi:hypothetical protein